MKIVQFPHPALRWVAKPLTAIDQKVIRAAEEMIDLMIEARGLGLAATQVALPYQLLVLNHNAGDPPVREEAGVYINPVILERKGSVEDEEGCLSFPKLYAKVRRAKTVKVQAYNLKGVAVEIAASDLPARVWQHEVDHLHGILFIDKMGTIAKLASRGALKEFEREFHKARERGEIPPDVEIEQMRELLAAGA
jgi:peptide deformylase